MTHYIQSLLTLIFAIGVMNMLLDCEIKQIKNRYLLGLYALIVIISDAYVLYKFGYIFFMKLYPLLVHLPVFFAFVFVSKFNFMKVFFVHWTLVAISSSFSIVGVLVAYFLGSSIVAVNIVCYILYLPTWFVIYKYIRPTFLYMLRNTNKGWLEFSVIPLSYSVLVYTISKYNLDQIIVAPIIWNAVVYFILAFSAYYMIFRIFKQTREQLTIQNEQNLLRTQVEAAKVHLEAIEQSKEKTIIYRHDMRHHLNLIASYLADDNRAAAQKYMRLNRP